MDYVIAHGDRIYPIEVKAGKSGSLKSLHQYLFHKKGKIAFRFDLNQASKQEHEPSIRLSSTRNETANVAYTLISLPLYAVEEIPRLCERVAAS